MALLSHSLFLCLLPWLLKAELYDAAKEPDAQKVTKMSPCWRDETIDMLPPFVCYGSNSPIRQSPPQAFRLYNLFDLELSIYWDNGTPEGIFSGNVQPGGVHTTTSYDGHSFNYKTAAGVQKGRVTVSGSMRLWQIGLESTRTSQAAKDGAAAYKALKGHSDKYKEETGRFYIGSMPPKKAVHSLMTANYIGQTYTAKSEKGGHWTCESQTSCGDAESLEVDVTVVSVEPRVLLLKNFFGANERELVRRIAKVKQATVGDGKNSLVSDTRKSEVGWIDWKDNWMLRINQRTADIFNFSASHLTKGDLVENLQVVHYPLQGKYTPHHDFGNRQYDRMITVLHYIDEPDWEGGTGFPLSFGGKGLVVNPPAGYSVVFYSMLADGNKDELSLHDGRPVGRGQKFICNQWIHDRSDRIEAAKQKKRVEAKKQPARDEM